LKHHFIILSFIFNLNFVLFSQDTIKPKWFNFNFHSALIINNSLSNYYSSENYVLGGDVNIQKLSKITNKNILYGYSGGIDFEFGKKQFFKNIITSYFDYTNSYFNLDYQDNHHIYHGYVTHKNINVKRNVNILGVGYGIMFGSEKLNFSVFGCYNRLLKKVENSEGYIVKTYYNIVTDYKIINEKSTHIIKDSGFYSFRTKINYNFKIKSKKFSAYIQRNGSLRLNYEYTYYAPWWMIGIQYYPLRNGKQ